MNNSTLTRAFSVFPLFVLLVVIGCGGESGEPAADGAGDASAEQSAVSVPEPVVEPEEEPAVEPTAEDAVAEAEKEPNEKKKLGPLAERALRQLLGESPTEEQPVVPTTKLSDSPGAPMVIEEIQERSADTPLTVPVVDPTVTNPTPTVTGTPIPTTLVGLTYTGGQNGGPLGNANGNSDVNNGKGGTVVFGAGGNARKIAFIVDVSGSMVDVQPFVNNELKRVIGKLQPGQDVTVIVFSGEGVYEVPGGKDKKGLRSATEEFKAGIDKWLAANNHNFKTGGRGDENAEVAILWALRYEPQLVFVLSDTLVNGSDAASHERAQEKLIKSINKANDFERPAKFNTIHFLYEDPLDRAGKQGTLRRLADETGGRYRFVSAEDLNLK